MTDNNSFLIEPFSGKRAFEEVSDQIRDLIYANKLKPGDKLPPERDLAKLFRAGRTAVREGLRVLERSGLIEVRRGSEGGSFVTNVNVSAVSRSLLDIMRRSSMTVDHLTEVRIGLEKLMIGSAMAKITQDELDLLRQCVEKAEAIVETSDRVGSLPDLGSWVEANTEFHSILAAATRNPLFQMISDSLMNVMRTFLEDPPLLPEFFRDHPRQHREIYEAVKDKDLRLAERQLEAHSLWIGMTLAVGLNSQKSERHSEETRNGGET